MKTLLLIILAEILALEAFSQGTLNILSTHGTVFRSQIYGPQWGDPYRSLVGEPPPWPVGTTWYNGPLLAGTGYTFSVYYGAATVTDPNALSPLVSTTFRTGGAAGLIAPIPDFPVPGVAPGERAMLQVRAWDNLGGTVTSFANAGVRGASLMFLSEPLGGGILLAPDMIGWTRFNIYYVPEPSPWMFAGLGALVFGFWKWRRSQGSRHGLPAR